MPHPNADIALLTEPRYTATDAPAGDWYMDNILQDDRLLQAALTDNGLSSIRVDWSDPTVDWSRFRALVFRTTWDYFYRFAEFNNWLQRVEVEVPLLNPAAIIRWNVDKHYLADLNRRGVPVVPSRYIERGSTATLAQMLRETGWDEAVVKPCVAGAARHTYRVNRESVETCEPTIRELLEVESLIIQPFQHEIVTQGEDSLIVIGGRYSHAVRKQVKEGDFRVQDDFGGTVRPQEATMEQIELAERAVASCDPLPIYGRVDMVRTNEGHWAIMELELIEPELWLRFHPPAATALGRAVAKAIS